MPHPELLNVTPVISLALCGSGTYGLLRPLEATKMFGIPNAGPKETTYYRPMAGRNLGMGIAVGLFTYWRDERALGTTLLCLICNGLADTYILLVEKSPTQNTWIHVMNIVILTVVGSGLLGWW